MNVIILSGADQTGKTKALCELSKELSCKYSQIPYSGQYMDYDDSSSEDLIRAYEVENKIVVITTKGDNKNEIQKNIDAINELFNKNRDLVWITASRTKGESIVTILNYCTKQKCEPKRVKTKNLKGYGDVCIKKDNERVLREIKDLLKEENITI